MMVASFRNKEALFHRIKPLFHKCPDLYMYKNPDLSKIFFGVKCSHLDLVIVCVKEMKCFSSEHLIGQDVVSYGKRNVMKIWDWAASIWIRYPATVPGV